MARIRRHLSFANVVSLLALFIALGGSSYAALSIGSKQIRNNSVRSKDLRNNDVRGKDVRNGTLLKKDFKKGQLPAGRTGPQGPRGLTGAPGTSGFASKIPSGTTIRGTFAINDVGTDTSESAIAVGSVSFPVPAPSAPTAVNFAPSTTASDDDPTCTGTPAAPTAPAGKVCLYLNGGNAKPDSAHGDADGTPFGFLIVAVGTATPPTPSRAFVQGTWAYKAP